jgi:uncharacterized protein
MKKVLFVILFLLAAGIGYFGVGKWLKKTPPVKPLPLLKYTFENLKNTDFPESQITLGDEVTPTSQKFYFNVPEKVSGLMNYPDKDGTYPVIIMFRGYASPETYKPGLGTQPSAKVLAANGFITLAPDFLGYAESASPSADTFEARFQTETTALNLLSAVQSLNTALKAGNSEIVADLTKIGIWGHSNGGNIALSTLAISGKEYPTVLWAPVSKPFPYSILYYTDETDDQGKYLRAALANFEKDYVTQDFSAANYLSWIKAPILINQGTGDQEVPYWWSDELVSKLKSFQIDVKYLKYPGADHNFLPSATWNEAIGNTVNYFRSHFGV